MLTTRREDYDLDAERKQRLSSVLVRQRCDIARDALAPRGDIRESRLCLLP